MKQGRLLSTILLFLLSLSLCIMWGCSSDSSSGGGGGGTAATLSALGVTATPASINPNGTSIIEATAYDASGNTLAGVGIVFTLDDPSRASISGTSTTNVNGKAQVSLIARDTPGQVSVTASSGNISSTPATVTILGGGSGDATVAALEVVANPDSINPNETTTIEATAYNASGNTIAGVDVVFTLDDPTLAFVTGAATTDSNGVAEVFLTARDKSGEVNVTATALTENSNVSNPTPATVTIQDGAAPDRILLTVTPASVIAEGTATVQAQVLDADGNAVADGTSVSFTSNNANYGNFTASAATTTNGYATATFKAANIQGTATVTVDCVGITANAGITIYPAQTATIEFVSATPQRIALQGSGTVDFPDFSTLQYVVKDTNGNPVNGELVSFVLSGPKGGEYIDATPGDPTPEEIEASTDDQGVVEVTLHSGAVAGPATVLGSITVTGSQGQALIIKSQSSVVSIGGGVPSAKRFSVAADVLNLPGLAENGVETNITAYLADRFGNYNILVGTSVSFITEQGLAIDTSKVTVDENGLATAVARTQYSVGSPTAAEDVAEDPWETALIDYIDAVYGATLPGHPRDGLCSVMVYVKGEEHFHDANANGIYNPEETFIDTFADPFVDYNDDGLRDDGPPPVNADPFEEYVDSGGNGVWNGKNGKWDADKNIFTNFKILLTGQPYLIASDTTGFALANGGSRLFSIIVCDRNGNWLTPGSTVTIAADKGNLSGATSFEFPDTNSLGPLELSVLLSDSNPDEDKLEAANISVSVTWKGAYSSVTTDLVVASGTVR